MTNPAPLAAVNSPAPAAAVRQGLPGFKVLNLGDSGAGKTHVIRTLLGAGIQPFVLATEPGMRSLAPCDNPACPVCKDTRNAPVIPWAYVTPTPGDISTLIGQAELINTKDLKFLCNVNDTTRSTQYTQFIDVLRLIEKFRDDTGKSWGPVHSWNTDRALVLDAWTSLTPMAMDMFCGKRPAYDKSDYQIAQRALENLATLLTCQIRCHVIVIAHPEREFDEVTGQVRLTVSTVGQKLAPKLPRLFDDVITSKRSGTTFVWSTAETNAIGKARNLPIKDGIVPDYRPMVESWKRAGGVIAPTAVA